MTHCTDCGRPVTLRKMITKEIGEWLCDGVQRHLPGKL